MNVFQNMNSIFVLWFLLGTNAIAAQVPIGTFVRDFKMLYHKRMESLSMPQYSMKNACWELFNRTLNSPIDSPEYEWLMKCSRFCCFFRTKFKI